MALREFDRDSGLSLQERRRQNENLEEISRVADVSSRIVPIGATGDVPESAEGRIIRIGQDGSANTPITLTLPDATGSGAIYRFVINTTNTGLIIQAKQGDIFVGGVGFLDADVQSEDGVFQPTGTHAKLRLNSTTYGGIVGDWIECTDFVSGKWQIRGLLVVPVGSTPVNGFQSY